MLDEYKADYAEASKNKNDSFSPKAFKRRIIDYCETTGIVMNPPQLFKKSDGTVLKKPEQTNYFVHQAWVTQRYFEGRDWEDDTTVHPKQIRELASTPHAIYFFRTGKDTIPADYDALMEQYKQFLNRPDLYPILDEQGHKVALTEEEETRWRSYLDGKQRKRVAPTPQAMEAQPATKVAEEDLPF